MPTYTVTITQSQKDILDNDLLDIDDWIQKAVIGKINNSRKRMVREQVAILKADPAISTIPTDDDALVVEIKNHKDYKNRTARDAAELSR